MSSTIILSRPLGPKELLTTFAMACVARTGRVGRRVSSAGGMRRRGVNEAYRFGHECRNRKSSDHQGKGCRSPAVQTWTPFLQRCVMARVVGRKGGCGGDCWNRVSACATLRSIIYHELPQWTMYLPLEAFFGGVELRSERLFQLRGRFWRAVGGKRLIGTGDLAVMACVLLACRRRL